MPYPLDVQQSLPEPAPLGTPMAGWGGSPREALRLGWVSGKWSDQLQSLPF